MAFFLFLYLLGWAILIGTLTTVGILFGWGFNMVVTRLWAAARR